MRISEIIDEALNRRGFLRGFGGAALGGAVGANAKDLHDLVAKKAKDIPDLKDIQDLVAKKLIGANVKDIHDLKDEPDAPAGKVGLPQDIIDKHFKDRPTGGRQYMPPPDRNQLDTVSVPPEIWNKHFPSAEKPNALKQRKYTNVGKNPNR